MRMKYARNHEELILGAFRTANNPSLTSSLFLSEEWNKGNV